MQENLYSDHHVKFRTQSSILFDSSIMQDKAKPAPYRHDRSKRRKLFQRPRPNVAVFYERETESFSGGHITIILIRCE